MSKKIYLMFTEVTECQSLFYKSVYGHRPHCIFPTIMKNEAVYGHKHQSILTPIVRNIEHNTAHPSSTGLPMHQHYQWQSTCRNRANQYRIKMTFETKFIVTVIHN